MDDLIVFAHMMKTAGTSLNKSFIEHFGSKMHIVPGGLEINDVSYANKKFQNDLSKFNHNLQLISGHPLRPYKDLNNENKNLKWVTFFRNPMDRYVSHYLYIYAITNHFAHKKYWDKKNNSIEEWERIENNANYQTKFIAGEVNFDKAVEILENKMAWVGITEEFENGMCSLKQFLGLKKFHFEKKIINKRRVAPQQKIITMQNHREFIEEMNQVDIRLYEYVKNNIWPRFRYEDVNDCDNSGKSKMIRLKNMVLFQINRQLKYSTETLNLKNVKRFYERWYR